MISTANPYIPVTHLCILHILHARVILDARLRLLHIEGDVFERRTACWETT